MRSAILGCYRYRVIPDVIQNTLDMCKVRNSIYIQNCNFKVTHFDSRCQATCVLETTIVAQMILHAEKNGGKDLTDEEVETMIQKSIEYSLHFLHPKYKDEFLNHLRVPGTQEGLESLKLGGPGIG